MIRTNQNVMRKLNILFDIVLLYGSAVAAYFVASRVLFEDIALTIPTISYSALVVIPFYCLIYSAFGLYRRLGTIRWFGLFEKLVGAHMTASAVTVAFALIFADRLHNLAFFGLFFFTSFVLGVLKRAAMRGMVDYLRRRGYNVKTVIVVGSGRSAQAYAETVLADITYGYSYLGYVADEDETAMSGSRLGSVATLLEVLESREPDELVIATENTDNYAEIISLAEKNGTKISIIPIAHKYLSLNLYMDQLAGIPLINIRKLPLENNLNAFMKRAIDLVGALVLVVLLSPLLAAVALAIKLVDKQRPIFTQLRIGYLKKPFTIYKFRTMRDADEGSAEERRTKLGRLLRKLSVDELPQLFNVIKGDMSLIGPRPELPTFVKKFKEEIPMYMIKHQVKPGMTGYAQIKGYRGDTSITKRIEFDLKYIENWSLTLDLYIALKTIVVALNNDRDVKKESANSVAIATKFDPKPSEDEDASDVR